MRGLLILSAIALVLWRLNPAATKELLRRSALRLCQLGLRVISRPYVRHAGVAVVFAPHQDDETLGCGALIARKRNDGLPVHVVFITDGCASHPHHPRLAPREIVAIRRQEARRALSILGVESTAVHFLNATDGTLEALAGAHRDALVGQIMGVLRRIRPGEIFLPCRRDGSTEHDATFAFVGEAVQQLGLRPQVWQYPVWARWKPALLFRLLAASQGSCRVPAEDFLDIKRRALHCYRSQTTAEGHAPAPAE